MKCLLCRVLFLSSVVLLQLSCSQTKTLDTTAEKGLLSKPSIKRVDFEIQKNNVLRIQFDLEDSVNEFLDVELYYSLDSGYSYQSAKALSSGDIGDSIEVGENKQINLSLEEESFQVALVARNSHSLNYKELMSKVDTVRLKKNVSKVFGIRNFLTDSSHLAEVRQMIIDSLTSYNYNVSTQDFDFQGTPGSNILARKSGFYDSTLVLVIGAHYDSTPGSPGADDNASGVAGLLEIARILSTYPTHYSIEFVAFDMEELGLVGSYVYSQYLIYRSESNLSAVNLDMIGYASSKPNSQKVPNDIALAYPKVKRQVENNNFVGDFIVCIANENSIELKDDFMQLAEDYLDNRIALPLVLPGNGEMFEDLRNSDHTSFWDAGFPAIFIGDGADTRNPYYNTDQDVVEILDFVFMQDVVKATLALAAQQTTTDNADVVVKKIDLSNPKD